MNVPRESTKIMFGNFATQTLSGCYFIGFILLYPCISYAADSCGTKEVGTGAAVYECQLNFARSAMEKKDFRGAVSLYTKVVDINLFEEPNYQALPELAMALYYSGDIEKAMYVIAIAKHALHVSTRIASCDEALEGRFTLRHTATGALYTGKAAQDAVSRMCGDALMSYYRPENFQHVLDEASLVRKFLYADSIIRSSPQ